MFNQPQVSDECLLQEIVQQPMIGVQQPQQAICQQVRLATERGNIKDGNSKSVLEIDESLFSADMDEVINHDRKLDSEIFIHQKTEQSESILSEVYISDDEQKSDSRHEKEQNSRGAVQREVSVNNEELKAIDPKERVSAEQFKIKEKGKILNT